jgi:hypothetical protein
VKVHVGVNDCVYVCEGVIEYVHDGVNVGEDVGV